MKKITYAVKLVSLALVLLVSLTSGIWAQVSGKVKVAAIYTVPVEQQWVSRIHKALNAAKARGEIEYSFSEKEYSISPLAFAALSALWIRLTHCCSTGTV